MIQKKTWEEFREAQLLWWVNRMLHLFGWAIVVEIDDATGKVTEAYPARCKFRGFDSKSEDEGFEGLTAYLKNHSEELLAEVKEN